MLQEERNFSLRAWRYHTVGRPLPIGHVPGIKKRGECRVVARVVRVSLSCIWEQISQRDLILVRKLKVTNGKKGAHTGGAIQHGVDLGEHLSQEHSSSKSILIHAAREPGELKVALLETIRCDETRAIIVLIAPLTEQPCRFY